MLNVATLNTMALNEFVEPEQLLEMHKRDEAARQLIFAAKQLRSLINGPIPAQTLIHLVGDAVIPLPTEPYGKTTRPRGRPKDPRKATRDQFVAKIYPVYLEQEQESDGARSPEDKRAIPRGDRAENTPSIRAAKRVEKEIVSRGYPRVGWREVLNICSSAKMK